MRSGEDEHSTVSCVQAVQVLTDDHGTLSPEVAVGAGGIMGWSRLGNGFHSLLHRAGSCPLFTGLQEAGATCPVGRRLPSQWAVG